MLFKLLNHLRAEIETDPSPGRILEFEVPDPDLGAHLFAGEKLEDDRIHHSYKNWMDLAEYLDCRFLTPLKIKGDSILLRFQLMDPNRSWNAEHAENKYDADSTFGRMNKLEEPAFLMDYLDCLRRVELKEGARILNLGINQGNEFQAFSLLFDAERLKSFSFTGLDLSASAIKQARSRFPENNYRFLTGDINNLEDLGLGRFDLVISVGTLQSPEIDLHQALRRLVKDHLRDQANVIFGFPNCRYLEGEIKYGARMKNYSEPELSLLIRDISFYKRYLQQHRFKVVITGKYYLFVTGLPIPFHSL